MTDRTRQYGFMLYLSKAEKDKLEEEAEKEGWSQAHLVREALKMYLKNKN